MGHSLRRRRRLYVDVRGGPCYNDGGHYDRLRSSKPHGIKDGDEDHAVSSTDPDSSDLTARHRKSKREVYTDIPDVIPRRRYPRNRRSLAWHQSTAPAESWFELNDGNYLPRECRFRHLFECHIFGIILTAMNSRRR